MQSQPRERRAFEDAAKIFSCWDFASANATNTPDFYATPQQQGTFTLSRSAMFVNPTTAERRRLCKPKQRRRKRRTNRQRIARPVVPAAIQAIEGLQAAMAEAAEHEVNVRVSRIAGIGQKLDG